MDLLSCLAGVNNTARSPLNRRTMMFEIDKGYTFSIYEGSTLVAPAEFGATVTGYNHPSVKLKNHIGEGHIINTSSAAFIKATLRKH
jgi:hypothetical protein